MIVFKAHSRFLIVSPKTQAREEASRRGSKHNLGERREESTLSSGMEELLVATVRVEHIEWEMIASMKKRQP